MNAEVIVVDDGSTDDSVARARELMRSFPDRMTIIAQANQGPSTARNNGLRMARGAYVCFLDVDDEYVPGFFEPALQLLEQDSTVVAVQGRVLLVDAHRLIERWQLEVMESTMPGNMILRIEIARQIGGFPVDPAFRGPASGEDGAFRHELSRFGRVLQLDLPMLKYRIRPGGHTDFFLDRAVLQNGRLAFKYASPQEQDGSLAQAIGRYRRGVAARMIDRLIDTVRTEIAGVGEYAPRDELMGHMPGNIDAAAGFCLFRLAKTWPARGKIVRIGGEDPHATAWLAVGCKESNRDKVTWITSTHPSHDVRRSVEQAGLASWVEIGDSGSRSEPTRLLLIDDASSPEIARQMSLVSKDGLLLVRDRTAPRTAEMLQQLRENRSLWKEVVILKDMTSFLRLP